MGYIGTTARAALPIAFALILGAAPQEARAGACQDAGLTFGCVEKQDFKRDSLRAIDIANESQGYFALGANAFGIPAEKASYVEVEFTPPADGFLIITGSATITGGNETEEQGSVACRFEMGKPDGRLKRVSSRFGGAANTELKVFDSMGWSTVAKAKGGKARKVALVCRRDEGALVNILAPKITVVFHPQKY